MKIQERGIKGNTVVVLDFGSQVAKLIADSIRGQKVYSVIMPFDAKPARVRALTPVGLILSGGPDSVYEKGAPTFDPAYLQLGIPVLGICYGMQLIAQAFGGQVLRWEGNREYGKRHLTISNGSQLLNGVRDKTAWMNHGDRVETLPPGFTKTASTKSCPIAAFENPIRKLYGLQFHPEVEHTPDGKQMFRNFLFEVCGAKGDWGMSSFMDECIALIRNRTKGKRVIGAISGGVDSTTLAVLAHRAIGDKFTGVFIDTGLLRANEGKEVIGSLSGVGINLIAIDASERFFKALKGVCDPEKKRKIIGGQFIAEFEAVANRLAAEYGEKIEFLAQGTLYPDVIESTSAHGGPTAKIKTHHNVGGLPPNMKFKLIEPFRLIFKAEVRRLAKELDLPIEIWGRHPFPGPGEAIRVLGCVTRKKIRIVQEADKILIEELRHAGLYYDIGQAFAVLLNDRSTGQQGEGRSYGHIVALRCVNTSVFMTADWTKMKHGLLERISARITGEIPGVNRVVYDITSKPPATIEWE